MDTTNLNAFKITYFQSCRYQYCKQKTTLGRVWVTNRVSELVVLFYFEYIYETGALPSYIDTEKDSKTGTIVTMKYIFM